MPNKDLAHPILTDEALELLSARFRALGDPGRLRILNLLMQGESAVQDLADAAGMAQATVSRHLGRLRREGIVQRRSEGHKSIYRVQDRTVIEICEIVCGGLADQLTEGLEALGGQALR
jgi:DNA-binding transcriptional ArsR family regulator